MAEDIFGLCHLLDRRVRRTGLCLACNTNLTTAYRFGTWRAGVDASTVYLVAYKQHILSHHGDLGALLHYARCAYRWRWRGRARRRAAKLSAS